MSPLKGISRLLLYLQVVNFYQLVQATIKMRSLK